MAAGTGRGRLFIFAALLALVALSPFLPALDFDFVNYDDPYYVTANPIVQRGLTLEGLRWSLDAVCARNWHPLTLMSHMLDVELFGLNPRGHHLTSLLWHAMNAVLLFVLLMRMTGALWRSLVVAALFAVHPLRVESVVWIAERKDVLSTFFYFLAILAYVSWCRAATRRAATRRARAGTFAALLAATALGLAAKAMVVTLPFLLLVLDVWPLERLPTTSWRDALRALPRLVGEKLPLFAIVAAAAYATVHAQGDAMASRVMMPVSYRLANATIAYVRYLGKIFYPHELVLIYPLPGVISPLTWLGAGLLLAALSAAALLLFRRAPYLLAGWMWFLGTLVPVIGIVQVGVQSMADRYTYVPAVGVTIAVVWGLAALARTHPALVRPLGVAAAAAILTLAVLARAQTRVWKDSVTLMSHALLQPSLIGRMHLAAGLRDQGRMEEAVEQYLELFGQDPTLAESYGGLSNRFLEMGRSAEEALAVLDVGIELFPQDARLRHGKAVLLNSLGREQEALEQLRAAVRLDPELQPAQWGLGEMLYAEGELAQARHHLERALALDEKHAGLHLALARLLHETGDEEGARAHLERAAALDPRIVAPPPEEE